MMRIILAGNEETHGEDETIIPYSVKECGFASIVEEAARIFSLYIYEGAKGNKNHNKRE